MRFLCIAVLLALLTPEPILSDSEASKLLVGRWVAVHREGVKDMFFEFSADGTFTSGALIKGKQFNVAGTWKIESGVIVETLTESNYPDIVRIGLVTRDKLTSISETEIRYISEDGKENTFQRESTPQ